MTTMQALHQYSYERSSIKLGPLPVPVPKEGHVLILVHAAALNPVDFKRSGEEQFPIVIGYDVAGVVHALGEGVTEWKVGDKVFGNVLADTLGPKLTGSIAEYCSCPADLLARIPENVSMTDAAAVPLVTETSIQAMTTAACKPGDNVFISGGAGGFGIHAIQVAKNKFKAGQVATTASPAKTDFVKQYGADKVIDYRSEDAGELLKEWANVVVDCTAETDMAKKIVKPGGSNLSIVEYSKPDVTFVLVKPTKDLMEQVAEMLGKGTLRPVIDKVYPLSAWEAAVDHQLSGRARGKIVIQFV